MELNEERMGTRDYRYFQMDAFTDFKIVQNNAIIGITERNKRFIKIILCVNSRAEGANSQSFVWILPTAINLMEPWL